MSDIKTRIQKLLNLAHDDAAAAGEADNAIRFARELMVQHNITEGDLTPEQAEDHAREATYGQHGGALRGPGRGYADGFVAGLSAALDRATAEERKLINSSSQGTALVVRGAHALMLKKQEAATVWLRESQGITLKMRRSSSRTRNYSGAFAGGRADGSRAGMGRRGTTRRLTS